MITISFSFAVQDLLCFSVSCSCTCCHRNGAKIDLLIMIAVGFGLSEALTISGGAKMVASWIVNAANGNQVGLVAGTYFVVTLFNAAVTNNAAVSIFFPIAWEVASQSKMDFYPILLTLMFAGSADFSTPYGYQCNLMVYEPGGYSFSDYLKFGMPLQIVCGVFTVAIVFTLDYWWAYAVAFAFVSVVIVGGYFFFGGTRERDAAEESSMTAIGKLEEGGEGNSFTEPTVDNVILLSPGAAVDHPASITTTADAPAAFGSTPAPPHGDEVSLVQNVQRA
mmetsp:Transcript_16654/g.45327  ORF Transcript_16654/g.45327 Transcript_16654/m.45327 type:complete len:279 (-) Transcript_16654:105-941(-)